MKYHSRTSRRSKYYFLLPVKFLRFGMVWWKSLFFFFFFLTKIFTFQIEKFIKISTDNTLHRLTIWSNIATLDKVLSKVESGQKKTGHKRKSCVEQRIHNKPIPPWYSQRHCWLRLSNSEKDLQQYMVCLSWKARRLSQAWMYLNICFPGVQMNSNVIDKTPLQ